MKIVINHESNTPVKEQIATQLSVFIAAGVLRPGEKMWSIRGLADRIKVTPATVAAAYEILKEWGLVVSQAGSGVRVVEHTSPTHEGWQGAVTIRHLASEYIEKAEARGYSTEAILEAVRLELQPAPATRRILVIDCNEDFHEIYRFELGRIVSLPIDVLTYAELAKVKDSLSEDTLLAASMFHIGEARKLVGMEREVFLLPLNSGDPVFEYLRTYEGGWVENNLRHGVTLGVVSCSGTMQRMAEEILGAFWDYENYAHLVTLDAHAEQNAALLRSLARQCDLFITDAPSQDDVARLTKRPILTFEVLNSIELKKALAERLEPSAFRRQVVERAIQSPVAV